MISLAVLPPEGRDALFDICRRVRARGGQIAFDSNYRPRLWADAAEARDAHDRALALADLGLPTLEDETALSGVNEAAAVADFWRARGVREVVVKLGRQGCVIDGELVAPPMPLIPIDTSGAGDAFNAGYLHARMAGNDARKAALLGHRLAGWVITMPGAVPPVSAGFTY